MSPVRVRKKFDCIAYKDKVQAEICEEIKGLTPQEQIEYYNRKSVGGTLAQWWRNIQRKAGEQN